MNFEQALNHSCNSAFAQIALELGKDNLQKTGEELGLTSTFKVDRTEIAKGTLDLSKAVNIDLGWAGIGQYTTMLNPCAMMTVMGAIANNGKAVKPYYVKEITAPSGLKTYKASTSTLSTVELDVDTAYRMKKLLRSNVENYYGDSAFPGLVMCGKTGTAEVGDESTGDNALFAGFSQDESFPYAIIVVVEDTTSTGRGIAVPIANKVLQAVKQSEKSE
ncbi:Penicillin-binding protein A [bioreactor metagenome]|uniref:Penicillin-binding protein A n=1 Tax=bioreactor metagenome TaxID=1076179 RepID=A0A645E0G5_9ZZZZ